MTTDQLAQLRDIAEQYTANAVRIDYREREIALAALPRLLKEREALLSAARRVTKTPLAEPVELAARLDLDFAVALALA